MPTLTLEQQRALALARARVRVQQQSGARATRQQTAQREAVGRQKEERGVVGQFIDWLTGSEPEAPAALTPEQEAARLRRLGAGEAGRAAEVGRYQQNETDIQRMQRLYPSMGAELGFAALGASAGTAQAKRRAEAPQREAEFIRRTGVAAPKPSAAREAASGVGRAFVSGIASVPGVLETFAGRGLGAIGAPGAEYLKRTGASDIAAAERLGTDVFGKPAESLQYAPGAQLAADIGAGVGSMGTFLVPGAAARAAGVGRGLVGAERVAELARVSRPAEYLLGTAQGVGQSEADIRGYEQRTGTKVADPEAFAALLVGAGLGATEVGVAGRIFERLPVAQRGATIDAVSGILQKASAGRVNPEAVAAAVRSTLGAIEKTAPGRVAVRGAEEALQEGGTQLGTNIAAQQLYDPNRDITEGAGYSALVGGIVGGGLRTGTEVASTLGRRAAENRATMLEQALASTQTPPPPVAEEPVPEPTLRGAPTATEEAPAPSPAPEVAPAPEPVDTGAQEKQRVALLRNIAANPEVVDKVGAFADALASEGLGTPNIIEATTLRDMMRYESDLETTAGKVEDIRARELQVARMNVIEPVLYNPGIKDENKIKKINADLRRRGMDALTPEEVGRVYGYEAVNTVYGPQGELARKEQAAASAEQAQRQEMLQQAVASEAPDKYRVFADMLDEAGLGQPSVEELNALQGEGTSELEALIPSKEGQEAKARTAEEDAAFEAAVAAREEELALEDIDYDSHPDIQANESLFEEVMSRAEDAENFPQVRSLVGKLYKEGILDDDAREAIREATNDADPGEKYYAAYDALVAAIEDARDARADDIVTEIDDEAFSALPERARADVAAEYDARKAAEAAQEVPVEPTPEAEAPAPETGGEPPVQLMRPQPITEPAAPTATGEALTPGEVIETRQDILSQLPLVKQELKPANPEQDILPFEDVLEEAPAPVADEAAAEEDTQEEARGETPTEPEDVPIERFFTASLAQPRADRIGFVAEAQQRWKKGLSTFVRKFNYKYQDAVDYTRWLAAAYGVTRVPEGMDVARRFELLESRKSGNQIRLRTTYVIPIEEAMRRLNLDPQDVGLYLWARSAKDRNALVNSRNEEVLDGSGMTDAEAQGVLAYFEAEGLTPKLAQIAKLHDNMIDYTLNERVRAGLMSKEEATQLRREQPFYTPLKGFALDGDMQVDGDPHAHSEEERGRVIRAGNPRVQEYIKARGRKSMPFNPLTTAVADAQFAVARIERNKVGKTFLKNVLEDPDTHSDMVKVFSTDRLPGTLGPKINRDGNPIDMRAAAASGSMFVVKDNGKSYFLEFQPGAGDAMYRAFANMGSSQLEKFMNRYLGWLIKTNAEVKKLKTNHNPIYVLTTAWMRDFQEAIFTNFAAQGLADSPALGTKVGRRSAAYIGSLDGVGTITNYLRGTGNVDPKDEANYLLFDQFLEDGGAVGHAMVQESETIAADMAKSVKRYAQLKRGRPDAAALYAKDVIFGLVDTAAQIIDMHARFATYRAALEEGVSRDGAASLALDSSLNLTRRGELSSVMDNWFFFASPKIEGARKLLKQLGSGEMSKTRGALKVGGASLTIARKLVGSFALLGMLEYLVNSWVGGDDDEDGRKNILDINDSTLSSRLIIPYGSGANDYASMPLAFGMGYAKFVGNKLMASMMGDISPSAAASAIAASAFNLASPVVAESGDSLASPLVAIAPDTFQPFADIGANRNYFGSQIYTERKFGDTPRSNLGRDGTAEMWKLTAKGLNKFFGGTSTIGGAADFQPEGYEYLVSQYLGGPYKLAQDVAGLGDEPKPGQTFAQRTPILKQFAGRGGEYAPMNNFFAHTTAEFGLSTATPDMSQIVKAYNHMTDSPEAWRDNVEKYPRYTDERIVTAYKEADSALAKNRKAFKEGEIPDRESLYAAQNEIYKSFNRVFNEVQGEGQK